MLPLGRDVSVICWVLGGASLPLSLCAAKKLKDVERVGSLADAAWLKDGNFLEGLPDVADD